MVENFREDKENIGKKEDLPEEKRELDIIARFGGDEFVIILRGKKFPGIEELRHIVNQRIEEAVQMNNAKPSRQYKLSVSVGVALSKDGTGFMKALAEADEQMYSQKRRRKIGDDFDNSPDDKDNQITGYFE